MIPLFRPSCSDEEIKAVTDVLKSGWWGLGKVTAQFEREFAAFVGVEYAIGTNSATSALDMAVKSLGKAREGDEIIVPALTFVSTALCCLYNGFKPVFADIDPDTLCIDWTDASQKITKHTRAVIPVHYGGHNATCPLDVGFPVIEDCAHAAGTKGVGKNLSCWSFHAVKNIATGDGGMITTDDEDLYVKFLPMRWCGIDKSTFERSQKKYGWDYSIETIGYKYHMNDIMAALGLAQLHRIDELNGRRKEIVKRYLKALKDEEWLQLPEWDENSSWHMMVVRCDNRNSFIDYLLSKGISAGVHYKPLYYYPMFDQTKLAVTEREWKRLVTLPLFPDLSDNETEYIIDSIIKYGRMN